MKIFFKKILCFISKVDEKYIWFFAIIIFLLWRYFSNNLIGVSTVLGSVFLLASLFWFLVPFLRGKDIYVPGYAHKFIKGKDDSVRVFFLLLGMFMFFSSLTM